MKPPSTSNPSPSQLQRQIGLLGAVLLGLGSMIGTGIFVSVSIAAGITGPAVLIAVAIAALVAFCNALNSAQLAASHPVSGGTYEYGYRYLTPWLGFTAGWMFLVAKTASAATAALGFAAYLLVPLGLSGKSLLVPIALAAAVAMTAIVLRGIQRSSHVNVAIVAITLLSLGLFVLAGLPTVLPSGMANLTPFFGQGSGDRSVFADLGQATALMFVAYTGYGRIATLGEEVQNPRHTIPQAIAVTMLVTAGLYFSVALVGVMAIGAAPFSSAISAGGAPLEFAARAFGLPIVPQLLALGAITAMLGVLLNLILGLSRVVLAMGRRGDLPTAFAQLDAEGKAPVRAVLLVGGAIALLTLTGNVKTTWSFSAFTVLIYYSLTNLSAWQLPDEQRLYPRWLAAVGMASCLFLAFWVDRTVWLTGLGLIVAGLIWHFIRQMARSRDT